MSRVDDSLFEDLKDAFPGDRTEAIEVVFSGAGAASSCRSTASGWGRAGGLPVAEASEATCRTARQVEGAPIVRPATATTGTAVTVTFPAVPRGLQGSPFPAPGEGRKPDRKRGCGDLATPRKHPDFAAGAALIRI